MQGKKKRGRVEGDITNLLSRDRKSMGERINEAREYKSILPRREELKSVRLGEREKESTD